MRGDAVDVIKFLHHLPRTVHGSLLENHLPDSYYWEGIVWLPILVTLLLLFMQIIFFVYSPSMKTILMFFAWCTRRLPARKKQTCFQARCNALLLVTISVLVGLAVAMFVFMNQNVSSAINEAWITVTSIEVFVGNLTTEGQLGLKLVEDTGVYLERFIEDCKEIQIPPDIIHIGAIENQLRAFTNAVELGHHKIANVSEMILQVEPWRYWSTLSASLVLVLAMFAQVYQLKADAKRSALMQSASHLSIPLLDHSPDVLSLGGITPEIPTVDFGNNETPPYRQENESSDDDTESGSDTAPDVLVVKKRERSWTSTLRTVTKRIILSLICTLAFSLYFVLSVVASDFCFDADQLLVSFVNDPVQRSIVRYYQKCKGGNWVAYQLQAALISLDNYSNLLQLSETFVQTSCPSAFRYYLHVQDNIFNATETLKVAEGYLGDCDPVHSMYTQIVDKNICTSLVRSSFHMWVVVLSAFTLYTLLCVIKSLTPSRLLRGRRIGSPVSLFR